MRLQRLAFARKCSKWTIQKWAKVMWSDESTFRINAQRNGFVRRAGNMDRYSPRYTVKTVKHPESVMIWGAFSGAGGRAGLGFLQKGVTMNSVRYLEILDKQLPQYMEEHACDLFMHDGAPCHRSKLVKD